LKQGGKLYFEDEAFIDYAEALLSGVVDASLAQMIAARDLPLCLNYPNPYKGGSNWSIPNAACLRSWMHSAGLEIRKLNTWTDGGHRYYGWAEKVTNSTHLEHPLY
jgi:hypothetical protein